MPINVTHTHGQPGLQDLLTGALRGKNKNLTYIYQIEKKQALNDENALPGAENQNFGLFDQKIQSFK